LLIIINILFILAISDKLEQVFSGVCCIILWDKLKLGADVIKEVKYLKSWHWSELLNKDLEK